MSTIVASARTNTDPSGYGIWYSRFIVADQTLFLVFLMSGG